MILYENYKFYVTGCHMLIKLFLTFNRNLTSVSRISYDCVPGVSDKT